MSNKISCQVCGSKSLEFAKGYKHFSQVTSDCKLWRGKNQLSICRTCGLVQKVAGKTWEKDTDSIYSNYSLYHQANGKEQSVFDINSGKAVTRSVRILEYVVKKMKLGKEGRYLDIGCGKGETIRSFIKLRPYWILAGAELNNKYKKGVLSISKRVHFYSRALKNIPQSFDLISLFHVLEHVLDPVAFLKEIKSKLKDNGLLVIDLPDYSRNPFDLFVADHCTHFTATTLCDILSRAGFELLTIETELVSKELVVLVKNVKTANKYDYEKNIVPRVSIAAYLGWIRIFLEKAMQVSRRKNFGIFGTSITATWLLDEVGKRVRFFVDEDPNRIGKKYMGLPVYHPLKVPQGSNVFMALPPELAVRIKERLSIKKGVGFFIPPKLKI